MIATCPQQNGNGSKNKKGEKHSSQRKGGGGGGASAEVSPEDLIQEGTLSTSVKLSGELKQQVENGEFGEYAKDAFTDKRFDKNAKGAQDAKDKAREYADAVNYLKSGLPDRAGGKITSQDAFDKAFDAAFSKVANSDNSAAIYKVRREIGNRVSRRDFDRYIRTRVNKSNFNFSGGSIESARGLDSRLLDSISTPVSGIRTYINRTD